MKLHLSVSKAKATHDLLVALAAFFGVFGTALAAGDTSSTATWEAAAVAGGVAGIKALSRVLLPGQ